MWKDGALGETLNSLVLGGASVTAIIVRIPSIMTRLGKPLESPARQEGEHGVEEPSDTTHDITKRYQATTGNPNYQPPGGRGFPSHSCRPPGARATLEVISP